MFQFKWFDMQWLTHSSIVIVKITIDQKIGKFWIKIVTNGWTCDKMKCVWELKLNVEKPKQF